MSLTTVIGKDKHTILEARIRELEWQLEEAHDTLEAVRTGQIDALVVNDHNGPSLYTLKSADHAYRIFIERMAEGALTLNTSGMIVYSNSRFASMVSQPLINVIGRFFHELVVQEDQDAFQNLLEKGGQQNVKTEICLNAAQGKVPVQLSVNPLHFDGINSLSVIVTDLTLQNRNQKELKEKKRDVGKAK